LVLGPPGVRRLLERGTAAVPWGIVSTIGPPPLHCELHRGEHADDEHQQDRDRRAGALVVADERLAVEQRDHRLRLAPDRSEEHTSELQSRFDLVCRLLLEKKKNKTYSLSISA